MPPRVRRKSSALLRVYPRERSHAHTCADQPATQPLDFRRLQSRRGHRAARHARDQRRRGRARRAHPRNAGPMADDNAVYSPRLGQMTEGHNPFAVTFAIPCNTPGLRFLCRESFDLERSHFDHPLASRFEEMDCVVFFDDVLVPWERVFVLGDVDLINNTAMTTHSAAHTAHQGAAKNLAKCEFVLGVALHMTQTLGNAHLPHSEERLAELTMYTELMRACIRSAEADATLDEWGVMCPVPLQIELTRNLFMTAYPRMIEILQLLGSSSFLLTPSEADFKGPLAPDIERYLATDTATARARVRGSLAKNRSYRT